MRAVVKYILIYLIGLYFISCKHHQKIQKADDTKDDKTELSSNKSLKKKYAEKLGVKESDIKNEKLYAFINDWYAVPYKYAGKDKHGIDCSGLASTLYQIVYQKKISPSTKALEEETKKIKDSDLKEGDLLFFNTDGKKVSHVGVYLQNSKFVHASTKKGVMISDLNEPYFKKTYLHAGRVK